MNPRKALMSSGHRAAVIAPSFLPVPDPFLFILTRTSHIQGAAAMECFKLRSKAWLRMLTSFFAVQLWASFCTSLSLRFFECKEYSQGYGKD